MNAAQCNVKFALMGTDGMTNNRNANSSFVPKKLF